jgi:hypothetical protein
MQQQHKPPINVSLSTFKTSKKEQCGADATHQLLQTLITNSRRVYPMAGYATTKPGFTP